MNDYIANIRNIGIFAHVDAGKTTLTEQFLLRTGAIRSAGRVDAGTAHTDTLSVERKRGISVRSGTACVLHRGVVIRVIDTPGHVDFSSEVETALLAVDGAVLVVSAVEGVQAQTVVICRVLAALGIPAVAFINKTDRAGADTARVLRELAALLPRPVLMEQPDEALIDALTACDDTLLALALNNTPGGGANGVAGDTTGIVIHDAAHSITCDVTHDVTGGVTRADILAAAARACRARAATPVFCGAALKGIGVDAALDGIVDYLPPPASPGVLSIAAYHVRREGEERKVRLRVFGGELTVGAVEGYGRVRRLRIETPDGEKNASALRAGEIGVAVGLEGLRAGDWLGARLKGRVSMAAPVLRAQVVPESDAALPALLLALERMHDETANLYPAFEPRSRRVHIRTMGEIHQQVLEQTLHDEHGVAATLMPPEVLYRETPVKTGRGSFDMMMDPWKARAAFTVEPAPRGGGVTFVSETHVDLLHIKYQKDIEKAVYAALLEGLTGWPVTDITVRLTDGRGSWLSWGGGSSHFGPVVPLGLFVALKDAGVGLLEPVYRFFAQADEAVSAALYYELTVIRAECDAPVFGGGTVTITGLVPVGTSQRFAVKVNELTHGRGVWRTETAGYHPAPEGVGRPIERTTPDPTNHALYVDFITGRTTKIN